MESVMQESVPSADRGNPSSPRVGIVTNKDRSTIAFLKQSKLEAYLNQWSMEF